jgi:hypothetical protein
MAGLLSVFRTGTRSRSGSWQGALVVICLCSLPLQASTVLEMDFGAVLDTAELVFEGRVESLAARRLADGSIHTFVRFTVLDVLKGNYAAPELELRFLGGSIGNRRLEVSDMQMPQRGETGFYFVESLSQQQVHPLVGWSQGHFLIETQADGSLAVTTAQHEPIISVTAPAQPPLTAPMNSFSKGVAKGVTVRSGGTLSARSRALEVEEFKQAVRSMAAERAQ